MYNPGSLGTNHDNFIASVLRHDLDVLAINETWLSLQQDGRAPTLSGYRLRHTPRPRGKKKCGGGVGFYIRRGISARTWSHPVDPLHTEVEQFWLILTINGKKLAVGTAYRPNWIGIDLFFDAMTDTINSLPTYDNVILLGDFNEIKDKYKFDSFLTCFNLSQLVTSPTHFTKTSESLIDVVCTDLQARSITLDHVGKLYGHCLVACEFNIKREKPLPTTLVYRPIKNINVNDFNNDLKVIRWELIPTLSNVNDMVYLFNSFILEIFDIHAPIKSVVIKSRSHPWITSTVRLMMKLRDEASSEYHKSKLESKKEYYKTLKSTVNKALYHEKVAFFNLNINNNIKNPKQLWKNIKNTLLPKKNTELPPHFQDPDIINDHFFTIPGTSQICSLQLAYFKSHKFGDASFHIEPVSLDRITNIIRSLKSNAEGCDQISLNMLLMTLPDALESVAAVINTSITTSIFPDIWKLAIVRPLPKITNPVDLKDLRPISILPCLSKILEKAVSTQLSDYLEKNNILPEVQSGFRKGRSTVTALLDVTDNILCAQDEGMCTLLVLLDFSRAFDSIDTNLLIAKLEYYGFDKDSLQWFKSYLTDRSQYVSLSSNSSTKFSDRVLVNRGVPQGSVLGPILFILYSADLRQHINHCQFHMYADDTQVYISCKPSEIDKAIAKLNADLENIALWSKNNCLLLNPTKTKYLIFGSKFHLNGLNPSLDVMVMGEPIERVYKARNLGLQMDCALRFEDHIAEAVGSCFYRLKVLYRMRPFISEELRIRLVESLVLSKLNYTDVVFGPRLLAKTHRLLQRVQNACARFCFNIPFRSHVSPFLNAHHILKIKHRRKLHLACLLFGVMKHSAPKYLFDKIKKLPNIRSCERRQCSMQLSTQRHRSAAFRGCFRYAASKCWNNIPPPIRNLQSSYGFKNKLKMFLLDWQKKQECHLHDTSAI